MKENKLRNDEIEEFFEAVLMLSNTDECYDFFTDICTAREIQSIAQRLHVAKLLKIRKTYSVIEEETGASTATISRVNRSLNYGSNGYDIVLDKLIEKDLKEEREGKDK
ncbi:MAG: YerC/YecD family TrpR-related protein [Anaerococcus sp.]|uniref:YerC/YecD family TrpR-related protein n=1 Tax=Anaerococcus sp. AGMB09787 TaxID=2922869 RepID=UPI001FAEA13B|nr:YerC/YecD family TrpR-related protein [Anaerococcus sp. AGMB09787]MCI7238994.1 YerC/YecD family TrpR-related protein [Anaerococcus sp.]MDD7044301.1 YerC/YecD family TrpR-related protein [Peptoniphilaceae bacterium]MDY2918354.1 YerC/YecD family TrpR-related protein [Anaerococcus sp.]